MCYDAGILKLLRTVCGSVTLQKKKMKPEDLSVKQIKAALAQRQLPTTGKKAELISRMQEADPSGRWMQEIVAIGIVNETERDTSSLASPAASPRNNNTYERPASPAESDIGEREQRLLMRERES